MNVGMESWLSYFDELSMRVSRERTEPVKKKRR
jgi:hypothetical protein